MMRDCFRMALLALVAIVGAATTHAMASCDSKPCKEAIAAVTGFIDGQAVSYNVVEHQAWLPFTTLEQAPSWPQITVFKTAKVTDVACRTADACTVQVTYDTIGTVVPFEAFDEKHAAMPVTYELVRREGRLLISSPLPAKFVDVPTSVARSGGVLTGSLALRYYYDALAQRIADAAK